MLPFLFSKLFLPIFREMSNSQHNKPDGKGADDADTTTNNGGDKSKDNNNNGGNFYDQWPWYYWVGVALGGVLIFSLFLQK
jgi:hypothetical protein